MYGEDKTSLEELKNTVNELQSLKIEILPKADKISDLNKSIEKMQNEINQVDENLLNNTQFAVTGNEAGTENTTEEAQQQEIKTSENSNLNILISNIDTLTEKVNQAVKIETERKAEEERKAKEEEQRKQQEQALANVLNGDFTYFAGTYTLKNEYRTHTITVDKNGIVGKGKVYKVTKDSNGIYSCDCTPPNDPIYSGFMIIPIGVSDGAFGTNKNKVRIFCDGGAPTSATDFYYKN